MLKDILISIQITFVLLFKETYQLSASGCSSIITKFSFDSSKIICALSEYNIPDITQIDPNLILPSSCKNIKSVLNGSMFYGIGGDNCDYTQPVVINYNSSPYYAQRVFIFPVQWVFQSSSTCPTITASISVNNLAPQSTNFPPSLYLAAQNLCDYFSSNVVYNNVNQLVTKIQYYPGQYTTYFEQLYVLIFKCPLGCSSCDSILLNCQSCADGYYLVGNSCLKCDLNCLTCINSSTYCLSCPTSTYLYTNNSCQSCLNNGVYIQGINCLDCHSSCLTCNGSLSTNCQTCPNGKYLHDDKSCKVCETNNGFFIEQIYCRYCFSGCKVCFGLTQSQCSDCYDSYSLYNFQCIQQYLTYNSSLNGNSMQSINQSIQYTSQIAINSAISLSFLQNIVSSSSFEQYPTQQLTLLNAFGSLIRSDSQNYESPRYKLLRVISQQQEVLELFFLGLFEDIAKSDI
ncbi:hypothetical protein ABPG73_014120 [Tetrahymena malaccensis]